MFYLKWTSSELATLSAGALYTEVDEDGWVQRELGIGDDGLITHQLVPCDARPRAPVVRDARQQRHEGRVRIVVARGRRACARALTRRRTNAAIPHAAGVSRIAAKSGPRPCDNKRVSRGCHGFASF
jgi:hypothetical protein